MSEVTAKPSVPVSGINSKSTIPLSSRLQVWLGMVLPAAILAGGVTTFVLLRPVQPPKVPGAGKDPLSLLTAMPAADVAQVRSFSELSDSLDVPVTGTVVPFREISLASEVAGKIIEKDPNVRSGNYVRKGQALFRIDPRDYELELDRVKRIQDQERASLKELDQEIANTQDLLAVIKQDVALSQAEVDRFKKLEKSFISEAEFDGAKRNLLNATNQRVNTENQIRTLRTRKARLELAVKLAETQQRQAELNLQRTTVYAPADGRIVSEQVEVDSYVQRGTGLLVIEDTSKVEVSANLRMDQLYWILDQAEASTENLVTPTQVLGQEAPDLDVVVQYKLVGRESMLYEWRGKLDRFDGAGLDPQSRTIPIRILVDDPSKVIVNGEPVAAGTVTGPSTLVRGMFVDVNIKAKPSTELLLVPKLAIKPATLGNNVWKFEPGNEAAFAVALERIVAAEKAKLEREGGEDAALGEDPSTDKKTPAKEDAEDKKSDKAEEKLNPDEWRGGLLKVVPGVRVVDAFGTVPDQASENSIKTEGDGSATPDSPNNPTAGASIEYWVCEANAQLQAGDYVVITPLSGIQPGIAEPVRTSVESMAK